MGQQEAEIADQGILQPLTRGNGYPLARETYEMKKRSLVEWIFTRRVRVLPSWAEP